MGRNQELKWLAFSLYPLSFSFTVPLSENENRFLISFQKLILICCTLLTCRYGYGCTLLTCLWLHPVYLLYLHPVYLSMAMAVMERVDTNTETELIHEKNLQRRVVGPNLHQLDTVKPIKLWNRKTIWKRYYVHFRLL